MHKNKIHVYIAEPSGSKIFLTRKFKMQIIFTMKIFRSTVIYIHAYTHTCTHFIMVASNFVLLLCSVLKNNITISLINLHKLFPYSFLQVILQLCKLMLTIIHFLVSYCLN